jgi:CubicO group peptidase (beta-lactamase class C family)
MTALTIKTAPNMEFHYSSANTQLLALIIERITNKSVSNYLETKIWQPLGMEATCLLEFGKRKMEYGKSFCCLSGTGQLISLNWKIVSQQRNWEGNHCFKSMGGAVNTYRS